MLRIVLVAAAIALPVAAQAQAATYCSGAVVADLFSTRVVPGSLMRATYEVTLRNTDPAARRLRINVTASLLDRPGSAPITLRPGERRIVRLGYQTIVPGTQALRGEQLANVTRVSCV